MPGERITAGTDHQGLGARDDFLVVGKQDHARAVDDHS